MTTAKNVLTLFTSESKIDLFDQGGTQAWFIDKNKAKQCQYVICIQNTNIPDEAAITMTPEHLASLAEHNSAFFVGKISAVIPVQATHGTTDIRYKITFSEYAEINIKNAGKGFRNPVHYANCGVDFDSIKFSLMPNSNITTLDQINFIKNDGGKHISNFSTDDLVKELAKRGFDVTICIKSTKNTN
jgi:hypothetical protein